MLSNLYRIKHKYNL